MQDPSEDTIKQGLFNCGFYDLRYDLRTKTGGMRRGSDERDDEYDAFKMRFE